MLYSSYWSYFVKVKTHYRLLLTAFRGTDHVMHWMSESTVEFSVVFSNLNSYQKVLFFVVLGFFACIKLDI